MSLGNNICFLRKQKKLTQEQLADRMRVTRQTVSRWESDEVVPELDRLVEMSEFFACILKVFLPKYGHWILYYDGKYYDPEFGVMDELYPKARIQSYLEIFVDECCALASFKVQ